MLWAILAVVVIILLVLLVNMFKLQEIHETLSDISNHLGGIKTRMEIESYSKATDCLGLRKEGSK